MKKLFKIVISLILVAVLSFGIYVAYVFLSNDRIEDNLALEVENPGSVSMVETGRNLDITTWNIGFGAYLQDYTFFMDGGDESRARSKAIVLKTMDSIRDTLKSFKSDFYMVEETDFDSTRTYHVDERKIIRDGFPEMSYVYAQNYHSPYLLYPLKDPHGANNSGMLTLAKYRMTSSLRRSLPIQVGFGSIFDLDRCFNVTRFPTDNGAELVLITAHLTAYTTDSSVAAAQLKMIYKVMKEEYAAGNYVICGGDMNKDLLGNSSERFGVELDDESANWCKPFPVDSMPKCTSLVGAFDSKAKVPSCRNADVPYEEGKCFVCTVDGFIITKNVLLKKAVVQDEEFKYSDHNPVTMTFELKQ